MKQELLYIGIARDLARQIDSEVLLPGEKLPSIRAVRQEYGVSMNTATQAFMELERRALIESRPRSGFFVAPNYRKKLPVPDTSRPPVLPRQEQAEALISQVYFSLTDPAITRFSLGVPDDGLLPVAKLNKGIVQALRTLPAGGTRYEDVQGNARLRRGIARRSFSWGGALTEDDIITSAGAMNALSYCLMTVTRAGDTLAVESPVYFGILQLAKNLGLKVLELPTHPVTGIEPDALKKVLGRIQACLLVSNFNNPLGSCMPDEHKKAVVEMLASHHIPLIEDDLYGDVYFGENRPRPCKAYDEAGLVLWCGSVSKTLAPGYRVGWVAPGRFREQLVSAKMRHSISSTTLTHEAIGGFLETGRYEHHLRQLRRTLHTNSLEFSRVISETFPAGTRVSRPGGGFVLWMELPAAIDTVRLYTLAMHHRISIAPGRMFTLQDQFNNCLRLSYGLQWTPELASQLELLGKLAKTML